MLNRWFANLWGHMSIHYLPVKRRYWVDLLFMGFVAAVLYGLLQVGREWAGVHRAAITINLSPWALPQYTFFSMMRGLIAYVISFFFTLIYSYWAAKDARAEKLLIPLLDILQSIPVLAFMPALVLGLVGLFSGSNIGLELAAVLMIFTGQAWNMTFSLYYSIKSVPGELQEAATVYGFNWWQRFKWVEFPYGATGLTWNSMMSMAGGWFFLMISESFQLGNRDFRLPGLGSYMSEAVAKGDTRATIFAILAMVLMIVFLDQVLWRPVVVWAQRFRVEETAGGEEAQSWFLNILRRSILARLLRRRLAHGRQQAREWRARHRAPVVAGAGPGPMARGVMTGGFIVLVGVIGFCLYDLVRMLLVIRAPEWLHLAGLGGLTLARVLAALVLGTLWTVPIGLWVGLNPKLQKKVQPVVQVAASFPAPMLFSAVIVVMAALGISLNWGSVVLMLMGTQWYVLFNVIAGAGAVPHDLREVAESFQLPFWQKLNRLYLPAIFPYLVTGWVTAAGGAWNASIVAEYINDNRHHLVADGLGAAITLAAEKGDTARLAASVILMSLLVVVFNRLVWRPLFHLAQTRYSLTK